MPTTQRPFAPRRRRYHRAVALRCEKLRSIDHEFLVAQVLRKRYPEVDPVVIADRYELLRKIGSGAYGTVYEAEDRKIRRRVALKVLDPRERDVATREAQLLAKLHRDFKPSNVRIGPRGQAVVVDFGLARHLDTLDADPAEIGVFVGTIDYAPPERLLGYPGDHRSDQFSFCIALWEALSGVHPFGPCTASTTPEQRIRAFGADIVGAPRGGWRVEETLRRGLSLEPDDRFPDMGELLAGLATRPRRWTWRDLAIAAVPALFVATVMTQLVPSSVGASSEFVTSAHANCLGQVALVMANAGKADAALLRLELAKRLTERFNISAESSRGLAIASGHVALEFEQHVDL